jgi:hypothetical protein
MGAAFVRFEFDGVCTGQRGIRHLVTFPQQKVQKVTQNLQNTRFYTLQTP